MKIDNSSYTVTPPDLYMTEHGISILISSTNTDLINPVKELIQTCDVVITITPEGWAPSTIMLESMILGKPALNIILDDRVYDFEYIKQNAAVATSYDSIDEILSNLIDNSEYRKKISSNALLFTKQFLCNYGNSSKKIANFLINKKQINA